MHPDYPDYPEKLYLHLDQGGNIKLSADEPDGEWALYKQKPSIIDPGKYYELEQFSELPSKLIRVSPPYFDAGKCRWGYFML